MGMNLDQLKPIKIVILGAGFGGVYTFKRLHQFFHGNPKIKLILVNQKNYFLFTPLLHEVATGSISPENIVEPLRKVLGCCLHDFYLAQVRKILGQPRIVETSLGPINYDYLVVALGAQTNFYDTPGASHHCFTLKSLDDAVRLKNHFIEMFEKASKVEAVVEREKILSFVVVGGGPTGVELAAEMSEFFYHTFNRLYPPELMAKVKVSLVQRGQELIPQFPALLRLKSLRVLQRKGIKVYLGRAVSQVTEELVRLDDETVLPTRTAIWVAGVKPTPPLFEPSSLPDAASRLIVNENLQLPDYPEIFVLGDMAHALDQRSGQPIPALAQAATKEARCVADNIYNLVTDRPLQKFCYQHSGDLLSLGQWMAAGEIANIPIWGHFTWWLWRTIYLSKLISWQKKLQVALDWTIDLFSPRDISEL